jgi:hypothetical protein
MALILDGIVAFLTLGLFAFLAWGAWLALLARFGAPRSEGAASGTPRHTGFEYAASLVLLALLLTTSLALA